MPILTKHKYKGYAIVKRSADHNYRRGFYIEGTFYSATLKDAKVAIDMAAKNEVKFPKNPKLH